jgi:precorrin-6A synthase
MRKIMIIGIGAGNPEYITMQAINALRRVDVLFITDKGREKDELVRLRKDICERYVPGKSFRTVDIPDPARDRDPTDYRVAVAAWHAQRAAIYEQLFREQLGENEIGAFLVWGDPSLYDSTLRVLARVAAKATVEFECEVIPGISSIQALTARHRIALNQIGEPVSITTGRKLAAVSSADATDVVVMLDGDCAFTKIRADDVYIYWGAYLGTADEILLSGKLSELAEPIERTRRAARQRKGWIMDTYLLRKPVTGTGSGSEE